MQTYRVWQPLNEPEESAIEVEADSPLEAADAWIEQGEEGGWAGELGDRIEVYVKGKDDPSMRIFKVELEAEYSREYFPRMLTP